MEHNSGEASVVSANSENGIFVRQKNQMHLNNGANLKLVIFASDGLMLRSASIGQVPRKQTSVFH